MVKNSMIIFKKLTRKMKTENQSESIVDMYEMFVV